MLKFINYVSYKKLTNNENNSESRTSCSYDNPLYGSSPILSTSQERSFNESSFNQINQANKHQSIDNYIVITPENNLDLSLEGEV